MSDTGPDVQEFLQRIVWSISAGLLWLFFNMTAGIFFGWLFFEDKPSVGNIVFYIWVMVSLLFLLRFYYRLWNKPLPHD